MIAMAAVATMIAMAAAVKVVAMAAVKVVAMAAVYMNAYMHQPAVIRFYYHSAVISVAKRQSMLWLRCICARCS